MAFLVYLAVTRSVFPGLPEPQEPGMSKTTKVFTLLTDGPCIAACKVSWVLHRGTMRYYLAPFGQLSRRPSTANGPGSSGRLCCRSTWCRFRSMVAAARPERILLGKTGKTHRIHKTASNWGVAPSAIVTSWFRLRFARQMSRKSLRPHVLAQKKKEKCSC